MRKRQIRVHAIRGLAVLCKNAAKDKTTETVTKAADVLGQLLNTGKQQATLPLPLPLLLRTRATAAAAAAA